MYQDENMLRIKWDQNSQLCCEKEAFLFSLCQTLLIQRFLFPTCMSYVNILISFWYYIIYQCNFVEDLQRSHICCLGNKDQDKRTVYGCHEIINWIVHRVVTVGGDGMYMEVLHGMVLRKQQENGIDFNNPDASLIPPDICFGIIPAGV